MGDWLVAVVGAAEAFVFGAVDSPETVSCGISWRCKALLLFAALMLGWWRTQHCDEQGNGEKRVMDGMDWCLSCACAYYLLIVLAMCILIAILAL